MVTIERNPNGRDGFCRYCGEIDLPPQATVCDDPNCEPSDHVFKECKNHGCRNILGPVSPESRDKYCSNECAAANVR